MKGIHSRMTNTYENQNLGKILKVHLDLVGSTENHITIYELHITKFNLLEDFDLKLRCKTPELIQNFGKQLVLHSYIFYL